MLNMTKNFSSLLALALSLILAIFALNMPVFAAEAVYVPGDEITFPQARLYLTDEQAENFSSLRLTDAVHIVDGYTEHLTPVFESFVDENGEQVERIASIQSSVVHDGEVCEFGYVGRLFYDLMTGEEGRALLEAHPGWTVITGFDWESLVLPGKTAEEDCYLDLVNYYYDVVVNGADKSLGDYIVPGWEMLYRLRDEYDYYTSLDEPVEGGPPLHRFDRSGNYLSGLLKSPDTGFCELYKDGVLVGPYSGYTKSSAGRSFYIDGRIVRDCWLLVRGERKYYAGPDGIFLTGEHTLRDGKTYAFAADGSLINGG